MSECPMTLRDWQTKRLEALENSSFGDSRYAGKVSLIIYTFPPAGREDEMFGWIKCSILQSWAVLGKMKTVIVASSRFPAVERFAGEYADNVDLQIESAIIPGNIQSMSMDCIKKLHSRFSTQYCLVIQDDGFPLRDNFGDFLGQYDFVGAPIISNGWKRKIAYATGFGSFNGGFSLRSRRLCEYASRTWFSFFSKFMNVERRLGEDIYYTTWLKLLPTTLLRFKYPSEEVAFRFAYDGLDGNVSMPKGLVPFGFHGKYSAERLMVEGGFV